MAKRVAVLAVNPVNGAGLFQYLETFYENGIDFRVYAVAETTDIRTNSGIGLQVDDTVANLIGRADEYDALVFSCGDAVPVFQQRAAEPYNVALFDVFREFSEKRKLIAGHCAAALLFDLAGIATGKRVAVHPLAKPGVQHGIATDAACEIDGYLYTAQTEQTLSVLLPELLQALK